AWAVMEVRAAKSRTKSDTACFIGRSFSGPGCVTRQRVAAHCTLRISKSNRHRHAYDVIRRILREPRAHREIEKRPAIERDRRAELEQARVLARCRCADAVHLRVTRSRQRESGPE